MHLEFLKCMRTYLVSTGDKSLEDYYIHFKGIIDELNQYIKVLKKQYEEYMFVSFFRGSVLNTNHFEDSYEQVKGDSLSAKYFLTTIPCFRIFYINF